MQGKGMHTCFEFPSQCLIHHPVTPYQPVLGKLLADCDHFKVRLCALGHAVHVTLVYHIQVHGGQRGL